VAKRFNKCLGVDIFDYSASFEEKKKTHGAFNTEFRQLDLENEKPDEQFDRLISFEVIEHLKNEDSVAGYHDILKEGGMAAISVPNKWWIFETPGTGFHFFRGCQGSFMNVMRMREYTPPQELSNYWKGMDLRL
jgi:2-polyprenyl-3-methyl-5-hydroxy-6-metoxy-1,4-benzoquinol methylase